MRRVALFLCMFALALAWPSGASAAPSATIDVIKVEGALDRPLVGYLEHQLTEAEDAGAVVVLQLNTSGTLD
jgi:membrane-bound ClpP family serine protease